MRSRHHAPALMPDAIISLPSAVEAPRSPAQREESIPAQLPDISSQIVPFAGPVQTQISLAPSSQRMRDEILRGATVSAPAQAEDDPLQRLIEQTQGKNTFAIVRRDGPAKVESTAKLVRRLQTIVRAANASADHDTLVKALVYLNGLENDTVTPASVQKDITRMFQKIKRVHQRDALKSYKSQEVLRKRRTEQGKTVRTKKVSDLLAAKRVDNAAADSSRFYIRSNATADATSVSSAEVKNRVECGTRDTLQVKHVSQNWIQNTVRAQAPAVVIEKQAPDKRGKTALTLAVAAQRTLKPALAREGWRTTKRYVDQNIGNFANMSASGTASVAGATALSNTLTVSGVTTLNGSTVVSGVSPNTLYFNIATTARYQFCVQGAEVASIETDGSIYATSIGGAFKGRDSTGHTGSIVGCTTSTRYDMTSWPFVALGSRLLIETDFNYLLSGGLNLGVSGATILLSTKHNTSYGAATMSTSICNNYGGYTTIPVSATIPCTPGLSYNISVTISPTSGNSFNGTLYNCRITHLT
ncbi:hypothetical protein JKP88DRAFT_256228 [Tribonema minus]|nr:hypothetical protein JKP88DRAFT_256228 [Tribonema minus]